MKIGALFAGYGGLEHGVQAAIGGDVAWYSEVDKGALKILGHRYPEVPNVGDITTVDWTAVEPVDVLTGGFPCQDVSHAGKRGGLRPDTRTGLWSQMAYAIDQLRPALVVAENVRGLLSAEAHSDLEPCPWCMGDGTGVSPLRALGAVLGDLADLGYDAAWYGLRAADVGAPHGRFRVFVVAYPQGDEGRLAHGDGGTTQDSDLATGGERRVAAPGQAAGGWAWADAGGSDLEVVVNDLLPTPTGRDGKGRNQRDDNTCLTGALLPTLTTCSYCGEPRTRERCDNCDAGPLPLLPTPRATDGTKGGPNQRGTSGDLMLPSAVQHLLPTPSSADGLGGHERRGGARGDELLLNGVAKELGRLLPTPGVAASRNGDSPAEAARKSPAIGAIAHLLPTPMVGSTNPAAHGQISGQWRDQMADALPQWGDYADAINRWEHTLQRPAPAPTMTSSKGNPQLSPQFVEWMMGLPAGWVTDTPHITRNEALKALGNGVVPQQAEAALRHLLPILAVAA